MTSFLLLGVSFLSTNINPLFSSLGVIGSVTLQDAPLDELTFKLNETISNIVNVSEDIILEEEIVATDPVTDGNVTVPLSGPMLIPENNTAPRFVGTVPTIYIDNPLGNAFDLSSYFVDDETTVLSYSPSLSMRFDITFIDNLAIIVPIKSFVGTETIRFYATDGEFVAMSNYFTIESTGGVIVEEVFSTQATVYITNCSELQDMNLNLANDYILSNNIDCINTTTWNNNGTGYNGFLPVGNSTNNFVGSFNGDGYTISNLYINRTIEDNVGLFGYANNCIISNVYLQNFSLKGRSAVGSLLGRGLSNVSINDVSSNYSIIYASEYQAGVIIGIYSGVADNIHSYNSQIQDGYYSGGLIGFMLASSNLTNSYVYNITIAVSDICGAGAVGSSRGLIENVSVEKGTISSASPSGGLVGYLGFTGTPKAHGIVRQSYSDVLVYSTPSSYVGGLVGFILNGSIHNSYALGNVTGNINVGGLVGRIGNSDSYVNNSYSSGNVTGNSDVGGLVGFSAGTAFVSFYDNETSGQSDTGKGYGNITSVMQNHYLYTDNAWDMDCSDPNSIWGINDSAGVYPCLTWEDGCECLFAYPVCNPEDLNNGFILDDNNSDTYYEIDSCCELQHMENNLNYNYTLTNNIDCSNTTNWNSGAGFDPVGNNSIKFTGTFDGDNYNISNFYINRPSGFYVGLFGYLELGTISDVGMVDVNITGQDTVGSLVAYSTGNISNSYVIGVLNGLLNYVGGLVGYVNNGEVHNSYSRVNVSGHSTVGGLVGYNYYGIINDSYVIGNVVGFDNLIGGLAGRSYGGIINNSYASGDVAGNSYVGGLAGFVYQGKILTSYSTGIVDGSGSNVGGFVGYGSSVGYTENFWDIETAGVSVDTGNLGNVSGITGSSTILMQYHQQYTDANWFMNCSDPNSIWGINDSADVYPCLTWEEDCTCEFVCSVVWNSSQLDYPQGVYELSTIYPGSSVTLDTFNITFVNVTAEDDSVLRCFVYKNQTDQIELNHTVGVGELSSPGNITLSYTIQPGDFDGSTTQSWFVDNCTITDQSLTVISYNDDDYPVYVKTTDWIDNGQAKDAANAYQSWKNGLRWYFSHNDANQQDVNFAFYKYLGSATYEGLCNDSIDNDGAGGTDCSDTDCQTLFFPDCSSHVLDPGAGFGTFGEIDSIGDEFSTQAETCSGNICTVTGGIGGATVRYTQNVSQSGTFKVQYEKTISSVAIVAMTAKSVGTPSFDVTDSQTQLYNGTPSTGLAYKILVPDSAPYRGAMASSRPNAGSSATYSGSLSQVTNMSLVGESDNTYTVNFDVYVGTGLGDDNLTIDLTSANPKNYFENDTALNTDTSTVLSGTATSPNACNDGVNNDLNYDDYDCRDSDCVGVQIGQTSNADPISCESPETTCWDGFDNDGDGNVDCADSDCNSRIGAYYDASGEAVKYYNATSEIAYCEYSSTAEGTINYTSTPSSCNDSFDNDADIASYGVGITCDGTYADCRSTGAIDCFDAYSCWGRNESLSSLGGICAYREDQCTDGIDNDFDVDLMGGSANWKSILVPDPLFSTTGADCDDYDCYGTSTCSASISYITEYDGDGATCWDGIDNDLDAYVWIGTNYIANASTGFDCDDPDCLNVINPSNSSEICIASEFKLGSHDLCRNTLDDDFDSRPIMFGLTSSCVDNTNTSGLFATANSVLSYSDCWEIYQSCGPCPSIENYTYGSCADGINNDYDAATNGDYLTSATVGIDCADADCVGELGSYGGGICVASETSSLACGDGLDNDGDGTVDCADSGCDTVTRDDGETCATSETTTQCGDGFDNDADGNIDCADSGCSGSTACPSYDTLNSHSATPAWSSWTDTGAGDVEFRYYVRTHKNIPSEENFTIQFRTKSGADHSSSQVILGLGTLSNGVSFPATTGEIILSGLSASDFACGASCKDWSSSVLTLTDSGTDGLSANGGVLALTVTFPVDGTVSLGAETFPVSSNTGYGGIGSGQTASVTVVESNIPVVRSMSVGPSEVYYGDDVTFYVAPYDEDSNIYGCDMEIDTVGSSFETDCVYSFTPTDDYGSTDIWVNATDRYDNLGDTNASSFMVNVLPIDTTSDYELSRAYYNDTTTSLVSGDFEFTTGNGDTFNDCTINILNGSKDLQGTETASVVGTNVVTCGTTIDISSHINVSVDGIYFIYANNTDSDSDEVNSSYKVFYICNSLTSSGVTADGLNWTCAKADLDNDGWTEGIYTTLYNSLGNVNLACDSCPNLVNTGLDTDGDGIDDACDFGLSIIEAKAIPYATFVNDTIELYIDAHEFSDVWVNLTKPDNSSEIILLVDEANISYLDTDLLGNYSLIFFANNSIGQEVNATDYFEVFNPITPPFNVTVINSSSDGINSTVRAYYRNAIVYADSRVDGEYSTELADINHDVEFIAYNGMLRAYIEEVDIDLHNGEEFGMDEYDNGEFLVKYGLETSYDFTQATVELSYEGASGIIDENYLELYKCDNYNFTTQTCDGTWDDVSSQASQSTAGDYFELVVTSFSGFGILQGLIPELDGGGSGGSSSNNNAPQITVISPLGEIITVDETFLQIIVTPRTAVCWFSIDGSTQQELYQEGNTFYTKLIGLTEGPHTVDFECGKTATSSDRSKASTYVTIKPTCYPGELACDGKLLFVCSDKGDLWLTQKVCSAGCDVETLSCNSEFDKFMPSPRDHVNVYLRGTALALLIGLGILLFFVHQKNVEMKEKIEAIKDIEDEDLEKLGEMKS